MEIFVLGDVSSFVAALNSVAMVLNEHSFIRSAALLGALVGLLAFLVFLTNKEAGSSVIPGGSPIIGLICFFVFFSALTIKQRVIISDIYTGNTSVVDNVPSVIAMPASVFSSAAYKIFDKSNTAFQSTNGSYIALGQTGFVAPLQILHTLRNGLEGIDPLLAATTRQFIIDCVPGGSLNPESFAAAPDALNYVLTHARDNGLTTTFTAAAPSGVATSCAQTKDELETRSQNLLTLNDPKYGNKPKLVEIVNQHLKQKSATTPVTAEGIEESVQRVVLDGLAGTTQSPQQFMLNALMYNTLTNTFNCLDQAADQSTFNSCDVMMTQASEQWKTDSAAAGSLFAKTMMPAMVLMQIMFYSLAPIVIIFGLIRGFAGIGMYVKFLGFGVWTASWMPVAAVIQMYIQNNVAEKLAQISVKALTPGNFKAIYYDVISTNLALASDMLAATPLVTATILGVSGMAISQLANNMGGKDRTDEKLMSPDLMKGSPLVQGSGMSEVNSNTGIATKTGAAAPKLSYNAANGASMASANSQKATDQKQIAADLSKGLQAAETRMLASINSNATMTTESGSVGWRTTDGQTIAFGSGASSAAINSAAAKAAVNAEAQMRVGASIQAAAVPGIIKALRSGGANVSKADAEALIAKSASQASAKDAGFMSRLASGDADAIGTLVEGAVGIATVAGTMTTGPLGAGAGAAAQIALRSGGKRAIVAGVQKAINAVSGAADRMQGVSAAVFDNTKAGAEASMKAAIATSKDLQHLNSNQQDQLARVLNDWTRQDYRAGDKTTSKSHGKTNTDTSQRSTQANIGESFKVAESRTQASESAFQRNAQQAIDSGVSFSGTAPEFAQFLRANPEVAQDLQKRIKEMEPVISGDAARMRQLIDNSVRSGMSNDERNMVAGAMALAAVDRGFNPMTARDPSSGLAADTNAALSKPDIDARIAQAEASVPQPGQVKAQPVAATPPVSGQAYDQTAAMTTAPNPAQGQAKTAPAARADSHPVAPAARPSRGGEHKRDLVSRNPAQARPAPAPQAQQHAPLPAAGSSPGGVVPGTMPSLQDLQNRQKSSMPSTEAMADALSSGPGHRPLTAPDARQLSVGDQYQQLMTTEMGVNTQRAVIAGAATNMIAGTFAGGGGSRARGNGGFPAGGAPDDSAGSNMPGGAGSSSQPAQKRDGPVLTGGNGRSSRRRR